MRHLGRRKQVRTRSIIIAVACATALAVAGSAGGGAARVVASASGNYAFTGTAAGSFFDVGPFRWHVQIRSDGTARGHYTYTQVRDGAKLSVSGSLHCATIIDNRVWVGGVIEESSRASLIGLDMWFQAQDNGKGKKQPPDMSSTVGAAAAPAAEQYCDDHPEVMFPFFLERGDLKVRSS
jgi:hypothetical protein